MDVLNRLKNRYSCRQFTKEKLEDETLNRLLEAAKLAPSAKNLQPTRVYVIDSEGSLEKIKKSRKGWFDEPCVLLLSYDKSESWRRNFDDYDSGTIDAAIVLTQLCLLAPTLGLETCIILAFDPQVVREEFMLSENEEIVCQISLGYPAAEAKPAPKHSIRKDYPIERL